MENQTKLILENHWSTPERYQKWDRGGEAVSGKQVQLNVSFRFSGPRLRGDDRKRVPAFAGMTEKGFRVMAMIRRFEADAVVETHICVYP